MIMRAIIPDATVKRYIGNGSVCGPLLIVGDGDGDAVGVIEGKGE